MITGETDNYLFWLQTYDPNISPYFFDKFFVNKTGNVGIGVTNPLVKLDIASSTGIQIDVRGGRITNLNSPIDSTDAVPRFYVDNNFAPISGGASLWGGTTTGAIWNLNSGNVGIGTTNPLEKLDLRDGNLYISDSDLATNGTGGSIKFGRPEGYASSWLASIGSYATTGYDRLGLTFNSSFGTTTERMRITPEGNIGVGTIDPITKLHVEGGSSNISSSGGSLKLSTSGTHANGLNMGVYDSNYTWIQSYGSIPLMINGLGNNTILNRDGGYVGIGTTNPSAKLTINGVGASSTPLTLMRAFNAIPYGTGNGVGAARIEIGHGTLHGYIEGGSTVESDSSHGYMAFGTRQPTNNVVEAMRIDRYGNLGIGTTSPTSTLHVAGGTGRTLYMGGGRIGGLSIVPLFRDEAVTRGYLEDNYNSSSSLINIISTSSLWNGTKNGNIWNGDSGAGNVGIGTTNPQAKLDVDGFIRSLSGATAPTSGLGVELRYNITGGYGGILTYNRSTSTYYPSKVEGSTVALRISGDDKLFVDTSGNVGIGTTAPGDKLDIVGNAIDGTGMIFRAPNNTNDPQFQFRRLSGDIFNFRIRGTANSAALSIWDQSNGTVDQGIVLKGNTVGINATRSYAGVFNVSSGALMVASTGNVGIGTTSPTSTLHVAGGTGRTLYMDGGRIGGLNSTPIDIYDAVPLGYLQNNYSPSSTTSFWSGSLTGNISNANSGNVGIGTTNPQTKNHIWSGEAVAGVQEVSRLEGNWVSTGSGPLLRFTNQHDSGTNPNTGEYNLAGIQGRDFAGTWAGGLAFMTPDSGTAGGSALVDRMVIREGGYVGIGTTNPYGKLNVVVGTTISSGTLFSTSDWVYGSIGSGISIRLGAATGNTYSEISAWKTGASNYGNLVLNSGGGNVGVGTTNPGTILEAFNIHNTGTNYSNKQLKLTQGIDSANVIYSKVAMYDAGIYASDIGVVYEGTGYGLALSTNDDLSGNVIERVRINQTGNVGIGTTNPTTQLHVVGNALITKDSADASLTISRTTANPSSWRLSSGYNNATGDFWIDQGSIATTKLLINSSGLVGINTTAPTSTLHIAGGTGRTLYMDGGRIGGLNSTPIENDEAVPLGYLQANYTSSSTISSFSWLLDGNTVGSLKNLGTKDAYDLPIITSNVERMRITSGGNVGIGTTNATNKLTISNGAANVFTKIDANQIIFTRSSDGANAAQLSFDGTNILNINSSAGSGAISFTTNGSNAMYITGGAAHNVGIGTTSPLSKLHLNGGVGSLATGLTFGDGDSGIFELSDDAVRIDAGGLWIYLGSSSFQTNTDFIPGSTGTLDLGSSIRKWKELWTTSITDNGSGSVGINTTAPTSTLHIAGGTGRTLYMGGGRIGGLNSTPIENDEAVPLGYLKANYNSSSTAFWSGSLIGNISNANLGNVGIGTTAPSYRLHVPWISGDTTATAYFGSSNSNNNQVAVSGESYSSIGIYGKTQSGSGLYGDALASGNGVFGYGASGKGVYGSSNTGVGGYFKSTSGYGLIVESGNVGIGTTNPGGKLDVSSGSASVSAGDLVVDTQNSIVYVGKQDSVGGNSKLIVRDRLGNAKLTVNSGGVEHISMAVSGGNVGIGTTNPQGKLDVVTNSTSGIRLSSAETSGYAGIRAVSSAGNLIYSLTRNDAIANASLAITAYNGLGIKTGIGTTTLSTFDLFINSSGSVGIGTTSPTSTLHIAGGTGRSLYMDGGRIGGLNSTPIDIYDAVPLGYLQANYNSSSTAFWSGSLTGNISNVNSGNVGIGTTNPIAKLDISSGLANGLVLGGDNSLYTRTDATTKYGRMAIPHYTNAEEPMTAFVGYSSATDNVLQFGGGTSVSNAATLLQFFTAANSTTTIGTERMRIASDGNIGIGTANPNGYLAGVSGLTIYNSSVSGISLANSGGYWLNWIQSDGDLAWYKSGEKMVLTSNGSLGIGTTTPTSGYLLDVNGAIRANTTIFADGGSFVSFASGNAVIGASSYGVGGGIGYGSSKTQIWSGAGFPLTFGIAGSEAMRITSSGLVGIGTTSPTSTLHIAGGTGRTLYMGGGRIGGLDLTPLAPDEAVTLGYLQANYTSSSTLATSSWLLDGNTVGSIKNLGTKDAFDLPIITSSTERMRITSGGNVGIGTTAPNSMLTVNGAALIGSDTSFWTSDDYKLRIKGTNQGFAVNTNLPTSASTGLAFSLGATGETYARTNFYSNGNVGWGPGNATRDVFLGRVTANTLGVFSAYDGTGNGNLVVSGNVGIGTTSPTSTLHIAGGTGRSLYMDGGRIGGLNSTPIDIYDAVPLGYLQANYNSSSTAFWSGSLTGNISNVNSGNVGIGTTNPLSTLHISTGDGQAPGTRTTLTLGMNGYASPTSLNTISNGDKLVMWNNTVYKGAWGLSGSGTMWIQSTGSVAGAGNIVFYGGDSSSPVETMRMLGTGNVGIGTSNPSRRLEVTDSGFNQLSLYRNAYGNNFGSLLEFALNNAGGSRKVYANIYGGIKSGTVGAETGFLSFATTNAGVTAEAMRIDNNGNVGVGTTNPITKLQISGANSSPTTLTGSSFSIQKNEEGYGLFAGVNGAGLSWFQSGTSNGVTKYNLSLQPQGGNVGIGTTNPMGKIHVKGADPVLYIHDTETGLSSTKSFIKFTESDGVYDTERTWRTGNDSDTYRIAFSADDNNGAGAYSDLFTILNNGNVGIGTTSPTSTLHIAGGTGRTLYMDGGRIGGLNSTPIENDEAVPLGYLQANYTSSSTISSFSWLLDGNTVGSLKNLGTKDAFDLPIITSSTERMRITSGGNVGIGTTNPTGKLHITDSSNTTRYASFNSNGLLTINFQDGAGSIPFLTLQNPYGNTGVSSHILFKSGYSGTTYVDSGRITLGHEVDWTSTASTRDSYLAFFTALNGSLGEKLRITSSGSIGIGTASPGAKLDVNGSSIFRANIDLNVGLDVPGTRFTGSVVNYGDRAPVRWMREKTGASVVWEVVRSGRLEFSSGGTYSTSTASIISLNNSSAPSLTIGNAINLSSSGNSYFNGGNVGIGTTSPTSTLHIAGGTGRSLYMGGGRIGGLNSTPIEIDDAVPLGYLQANYTSSSTAFWSGSLTGNISNANSGNVGIGMTAPEYKLQIEGSPGATALKLIGGQVGIDGNDITILQMGRSGATYRGSEIAVWQDGADYDNTGFKFRVHPSNSATDAPADAMTIKANGNVGVGTTAPASILHLYKDAITGTSLIIENNSSLDSTAANILFKSNSANNYRGMGTYYYDVPSQKEWYIGSPYTNNDQIIIARKTSVTTPGGTTAQLANALVTINNVGNVGIGTTAPGNKLAISGSASSIGAFIDNTNTAGYGVLRINSGNADAATGAALYSMGSTYSGVGAYAPNTTSLVGFNSGGLSLSAITGDIKMFTAGTAVANERLRITNGGNVGIGTNAPGAYKLKVAGDVAITGALLTQTGSDFAEEFKADTPLEPGTVVTMGDNGYKSVKACERSYDKTVVGIISDNPSIIAGRTDIDKENPEKVVVAMMGVVTVKVSNVNGQIEKGDLLTSSSLRGYAMKAKNEKQGTIIGKALEDLNTKKGKIKVLVNLQ